LLSGAESGLDVFRPVERENALILVVAALPAALLECGARLLQISGQDETGSNLRLIPLQTGDPKPVEEPWRRGRAVSSGDDVQLAFGISTAALEVIQHEALGEEHVADRLLLFVDAERDAGHDHGTRRERLNGYANSFLSTADATGAHPGERRRDCR
jgi:hypothetical protein